ncbi:MAG TPA: hypothetical protein VK785_02950, partial [Opitutaceae bacterium]|nr:hypothetical protein [Opitutaceae bacterium]
VFSFQFSVFSFQFSVFSLYKVPGPTLQTDALVLLKQPPADAFQSFTVFSAEHGVLLALQRIPKKNATATVALDLFDDAALFLESSNQGRTWFVRESRLLSRPAGIGRRYESLRFASALTALIARNPVPDESRAPIAALLRAALAAFAKSARPELIYFKSLYRFARDEGYPVKQEWLAGLPAADRTQAERLLATPLATLEETPSAIANPQLATLLRRLEEYLRTHTEILLG